jgi:hypothetical protein
MATREYEISGLDLGRTLSKAQTLSARAVKKGLSGGFTLSTRSEFTTDQYGVRSERTFLVVEGESPCFEGWTFVAKVEYVNGDPVVTGSPYYEGPAVDRSTLRADACDYCGINTRRTKTVVVENEDGERKQVGTTCLKDFLGSDFSVAWVADPFKVFEDSPGCGGGPRSMFVDYVLSLAACVIRQAGFVPASSFDPPPTRSQVALLLGMGSYKDLLAAKEKYVAVTDADKATAAEALDFGKAMTGDSDYVLNLQAVLKEPMFDEKYLGLVVSLVGVYLRSKGEEAQRKAEAVAVTEALYAEPKTKVDFDQATVGRIVGFETQWGYSEVIIFVADGYRFKWMTSAAPEFLEEGMTVSLKGTVKGLDEYQGQVSTQLLRCKVAAA